MIYSAFISYSSADVGHARWLQRALESYRLPASNPLDHPAVRPDGRRLKPVFRDRDELSAAHDLGASIRRSLAQCEALIVLCSPASARSKWVDAEVQEFQRLGRGARIFCLLVEAAPDGSIAGCFPPSLIGDGAEPLAADLRRAMDGPTAAMLKLVAGILGLDFDRLRQREQIRRNRQLALVATASLAGLVVTSGLAVAAYLARNEAIEQRDLARVRTATAEQTVAFVKSMFEVADPTEARGSTITAREILDGARERYRTALRNEPVVQSEIALTLSEVYASLGLLNESEDIAMALPAAGRKDPLVAARWHIVRGEIHFNRLEDEAAAAAFRESLRVQRGSEQDSPALMSRAYSGLGQALTGLSEYVRADQALREAFRIDTGRGNEGQRDVARDLEALGLNRYYAGDLDAAERDIERANEIRLSLEGSNSPSVSDNFGTLAAIAYREGRNAEAERLFRSRLAIDEHVLGKDHPDVALTLNNLARLLVERRAFATAGPMLERAIAITRSQRGDAYDELAYMLASLGLVRRERGQTDEAETLLREAVALAREQGHPSLALSTIELASLLCARRRFPDATSLLDDASMEMDADPREAWRVSWLRLTRAQCLLDAGRANEAREMAGDGVARIAERWPMGSYYRDKSDLLGRALRAGAMAEPVRASGRADEI